MTAMFWTPPSSAHASDPHLQPGRFPRAVSAKYGIGACHPDLFLMDQLNLDAGRVCTAMHQHRASLKNPPKIVEKVLVTLEAQGFSRFS